MSSKSVVRESRRSTRVGLKVMLETKGRTEPLACDGETQVVDLHGALISTPVALRVGLEVETHVILRDKRAPAKVVYMDPEQPRQCGIALAQPQNIWGFLYPQMTGGKIIQSENPIRPGESISASDQMFFALRGWPRYRR